MSFNWDNYANEYSPIGDFFSNQPRIYLFQGGDVLGIGLLCFAAFLTLLVGLILVLSPPSLSRTFATIATVEIFFIVAPRSFKTFLLNFSEYPNLDCLFTVTSIEMTFNYALFLQFTSSVMLYVFLRNTNTKSGMTFFMSIALFSCILAITHVNFNVQLNFVPFVVFFLFFACFSIGNICLFIFMLLKHCTTKSSPEEKKLGFWLLLFLSTSCPPTLFMTIITSMDFLFVILGVTTAYPIPYVYLTTLRYNVFEATPICILISFVLLLPDIKNVWKRKRPEGPNPPDRVEEEVKTVATAVTTRTSSPTVTSESPLTVNISPTPRSTRIAPAVQPASFSIHIQPIVI
ncbi:unnamed protein product [Caenorhabditis auriculariae]|uniref:Uncharacterized protein n=1 Tax=Caenorhabditis auriculariae TaxID=2777116 RepID=A0A8S1I0A3_9PELO|nr:unnamed protein product [Caenorhabditis auriculariae]